MRSVFIRTAVASIGFLLPFAQDGSCQTGCLGGLAIPGTCPDPMAGNDQLFHQIGVDRIGANLAADISGNRFASVFPRDGYVVAEESNKGKTVKYITLNGIVKEIYVEYDSGGTQNDPYGRARYGDDIDETRYNQLVNHLSECDAKTNGVINLLTRLLVRAPIHDTGYGAGWLPQDAVKFGKGYDLSKDGFGLPSDDELTPRRVVDFGLNQKTKVTLYEIMFKFIEIGPTVSCNPILWLR